MKISTLFIVCAVTTLVFTEARSDGSWRLSDHYEFLRSRRQDREQGDRVPHRTTTSSLPEPPPRGGDHHIPRRQEPNTSSAVSIRPRTTPPSPESEPVVVPKFSGACWIAFCNVLLFALRPDPDVYWPARVPRVLWELILWLNLRRAHYLDNLPSSFYTWLVFLTGTTGLADLFIWAPVYGAFVNFQTCEGGWLQPKVCRMDPIKGYSRLLVAVQAVVGGLVYLHTAVQALHAMHVRRVEDQRRHEQQQQQQLFLQQQQQQQQHAMSSPSYRYAPLPFEAEQRPYHRSR